jgi:Secretion system C-terminal sorting domain
MKPSAIFLIIISVFALYKSSAQVTAPAIFNSCGGSITNAAGTFEYSIGEATVFTNTNANIVITQGVLQPFDDVLTSVDIFNITTQVKIFPNPTAMTVYLQPAFTEGGNLRCEIYNAEGKQLQKKETRLVRGNELQSFHIDQYPQGLYLLKVVYKTGIKEGTVTYKIQKLK